MNQVIGMTMKPTGGFGIAARLRGYAAPMSTARADHGTGLANATVWPRGSSGGSTG
jgi:hypothetical protein